MSNLTNMKTLAGQKNGETAVADNDNQLAILLSEGYGLKPEQAQQIHELAKAIGKLELELKAAQAVEKKARKTPRCCGSEFWDKDIYLYANHGHGDECPLHGHKPNKRIRKYIGNDPDKVAAVKEAMSNFLQWQQTERGVADIEEKLNTAKAGLFDAYEKRNGRFRWNSQPFQY